MFRMSEIEYYSTIPLLCNNTELWVLFATVGLWVSGSKAYRDVKNSCSRGRVDNKWRCELPSVDEYVKDSNSLFIHHIHNVDEEAWRES